MTKKDLLHPNRFLYALIFASLFTFIGYVLPRLYLQYVDTTRYVKIEAVSLDKKVYTPCEEQVGVFQMKIKLNSRIDFITRLMLVLEGDNNFKVIKQTQSEGFVAAQAEEQFFTLVGKLPCDLADGQYLYRGELIYKIAGVEKIEPFATGVFTVEATPSSRLDSELQ